MVTSLNPETTKVRLTIVSTLSLIALIAGFFFMLGGIYFNITSDIQTLKARIQSLENAVTRLEHNAKN